MPTEVWRQAVHELDGAYAQKTLKGLVEHFGWFEAWCAARGVRSLPADPASVAAHVSAIYPTLASSTVRCRVSAIRWVHRLLDHPDPTAARVVILAYRRGLRQHGRRHKQAVPLRIEARDAMLAAASPDLFGLRDRLIVSLAYDTLCRPCELVALRLEDVRFLEDGTARIQVRMAKNDPLGEGAAAYVSRPTAQMLQRWMRDTGLNSGPILLEVRSRGPRGSGLHRDIPARRVRALAHLAGLPDPDRLTGYSLRVGAVQDLVAAGCSQLEIMRAGRWRSAAVIARYAQAAPVNLWAAPKSRAALGRSG